MWVVVVHWSDGDILQNVAAYSMQEARLLVSSRLLVGPNHGRSGPVRILEFFAFVVSLLIDSLTPATQGA